MAHKGVVNVEGSASSLSNTLIKCSKQCVALGVTEKLIRRAFMAQLAREFLQ
jgi:hypothetical protein